MVYYYIILIYCQFTETIILRWNDKKMPIRLNELNPTNENEKKLIQYLAKSDDKRIEESLLLIENYTGYKIKDFFGDSAFADIGLMLFIALLEKLSGQNIFKIYNKAFQAIIQKQYDNQLVRNKIIDDISAKLKISVDFLNELLLQFNDYVTQYATFCSKEEKDTDELLLYNNYNSIFEVFESPSRHLSNSYANHPDDKPSTGMSDSHPGNVYSHRSDNTYPQYGNSPNDSPEDNFYDRELYQPYRGVTTKQRKVYIPVALLTVIIVILFSTVFLSPDLLNIPAFIQDSHELLEVKGLTLKYVLVAVSCEMYDVNVRIRGDQPEFYKEYGKDSYHHYLWIKDTYRQLPKDMKRHLETIYCDGIYEGELIYLLADLEDEAGVNQIVYAIKTSKDIPVEVKAAAEEFYPYFYEEYLREYIRMNRVMYDRHAEEMNKKIQEEKPNILEFIEETSGMQFERKYKPVIYYTMRPGNALGFIYGDQFISLIPGTEHHYESLFFIPYHEFSHGIFNQITSTKEFKQVADTLKSNSKMRRTWENGFYDVYYSWYDWCEENLVEGFAMYLEYKAKGKLPDSIESIRPYDKAFFQYLVDIDFNPETMNLKDVSIDFLESIADE